MAEQPSEERFCALRHPMTRQDLEALARLPTLDELFLQHLPTKQGHNYNPAYERHFSATRLHARRVVEIGVEAGTSLRLWKDYFPNAEIIGFDINERCLEHEDDRIRIIIGDQNSIDDIAKIPEDCDIIIDDGLHTQNSQILCFDYLYRHRLASQGIYVIEDIVGGMRTIDHVQRLAKLLNVWPEHLPGSKWSSFDSGEDFGRELDKYSDEDAYFLLNTIGVSIYRHIAFVDKGRNPEDGQAAFRRAYPNKLEEMGAARGNWLAAGG